MTAVSNFQLLTALGAFATFVIIFQSQNSSDWSYYVFYTKLGVEVVILLLHVPADTKALGSKRSRFGLKMSSERKPLLESSTRSKRIPQGVSTNSEYRKIVRKRLLGRSLIPVSYLYYLDTAKGV